MMSREVTEGLQQQGADEAIQYTLTVAPTPTSVTDVTVYDVTGIPVDVTATVMPAASAAPMMISRTSVLAIAIGSRHCRYGCEQMRSYAGVGCQNPSGQ